LPSILRLLVRRYVHGRTPVFPLKCGSCDGANSTETKFWMSKIDAIGFLFLSLLLTGPVWAITALIEEYDFIAFLIVLVSFYLAYLDKQYKVIAILVAELFIDMILVNLGFYSISLLVSTAFVLTFIKVGRKIYGFFFMCVNYKFNFKLVCKDCGQINKHISLPEKE